LRGGAEKRNRRDFSHGDFFSAAGPQRKFLGIHLALILKKRVAECQIFNIQ